MQLHHTPHGRRGGAHIVADGGTDKERIVGHSRRQPFPLGGYFYTVTNTGGVTVYQGSSIAEGLRALAGRLESCGHYTHGTAGGCEGCGQ